MQQREIRNDRDNFDLKLTWQRNPAHNIWAKFGMLDAEVVDNFSLGFDEGSLGDTRVYVAHVGHTWTLSPNLVLDGNFGMNRQDQQVTGPDFGQNLGLDLGIPGTNGTDERAERPARTSTSLRHPERRAARTPTSTTSAPPPTGCRSSARSAATRSAPRSPGSRAGTRCAPASTSCATS